MLLIGEFCWSKLLSPDNSITAGGLINFLSELYTLAYYILGNKSDAADLICFLQDTEPPKKEAEP